MYTGMRSDLLNSDLHSHNPPARIREPGPGRNPPVSLGHGLAGSDLDNLWDKNLFVTMPAYGRKFMQSMHHPFHEVLACLYLNNGHAAIAYNSYFRGEMDTALAHLPTVLNTARQLDASGVLLAHNPVWYGDSELPDLGLIHQQIQAVGIALHDFLLIGGGGNILSMRVHGAL